MLDNAIGIRLQSEPVVCLLIFSAGQRGSLNASETYVAVTPIDVRYSPESRQVPCPLSAKSGHRVDYACWRRGLRLGRGPHANRPDLFIFDPAQIDFPNL